jgi:hypothetical protein
VGQKIENNTEKETFFFAVVRRLGKFYPLDKRVGRNAGFLFGTRFFTRMFQSTYLEYVPRTGTLLADVTELSNGTFFAAAIMLQKD